MIPFNAICTCGHTLAAHTDHLDPMPCAKLTWKPAPRACPCLEFIWDNGKVAE